MRIIFALGILCCIYSGAAVAQNANLETLCEAIDVKVMKAQNPSKVFHSLVFSDSCSFQFSDEKSTGITIDLDRYKSREEVAIELESLKESLIRRDALEYEDNRTRHRYQKLDHNGFWDKAVSYRNGAVPSHFTLLRRGTYLIVILGEDFSAMMKTERLLRNIPFE